MIYLASLENSKCFNLQLYNNHFNQKLALFVSLLSNSIVKLQWLIVIKKCKTLEFIKVSTTKNKHTGALMSSHSSFSNIVLFCIIRCYNEGEKESNMDLQVKAYRQRPHKNTHISVNKKPKHIEMNFQKEYKGFIHTYVWIRASVAFQSTRKTKHQVLKHPWLPFVSVHNNVLQTVV